MNYYSIFNRYYVGDAEVVLPPLQTIESTIDAAYRPLKGSNRFKKAELNAFLTKHVYDPDSVISKALQEFVRISNTDQRPFKKLPEPAYVLDAIAFLNRVYEATEKQDREEILHVLETLYLRGFVYDIRRYVQNLQLNNNNATTVTAQSVRTESVGSNTNGSVTSDVSTATANENGAFGPMDAGALGNRHAKRGYQFTRKRRMQRRRKGVTRR